MATVYISNTAIQRVKNSLNIQNQLQSRSTARFTIFDDLGAGAFTTGQSVQAVHGQGAAWLPGWAHRVRLTLDHAKFSASVTHFPVMVKIAAASGIGATDLTRIFDELGANKLKLAFTKSDGITQLYAEIDQWDAVAESAVIWLSKSDWTISHTTDTVIYLYYDALADDNTGYVGVTGSTPGKAVWNSNFVAVYHMNDGADNAHINDSTASELHGAKKGANEPVMVDALTGKAQRFDGTDDYVNLGAGSNLNGKGAYTIENFFNLISQPANEDKHLLGCFTAAGPDYGYYLSAKSPNGIYHGRIEFYSKLATGGGILTASAITLGTPLYAAFTYNSSLLTAYVNGTQDATPPVASSGAVTSGANTVYMARYGSNYANVDVYEVRISSVARSTAWIAATNYTLRDSVITASTEDDELLFSGFIASPTRTRVAPADPALYWQIDCIDNSYLADKRIVAETYQNRSAGYIVRDIIANYLAAEGVTEGIIEDGPTIVEALINYQRANLCFDALAEKAHFIWQIDKFKRLHFHARTVTPAPFAIDDGDMIRDSDIRSELTEANPLYRNRQYIRANNITSLQTEHMTGDGVLVAFPTGYMLAKVPDIWVNTVAQTVGIKGVDTGKDVYWNKGEAIITFDSAPVAGADIEIQYYGTFGIIAQVDDNAQQAARAAVEGGTGIVEDIADEMTITQINDAFADGAAKLQENAVDGKQFKCAIRRIGIEPGQVLPVTYAAYGLISHNLLVESVTISEIAPDQLAFELQVSEGPLLGDWTDFFKAMATRYDDILDRLSLGKDATPIILITRTGTLTLTESDSVTVFACPVPSAALFPDAELYPC